MKIFSLLNIHILYNVDNSPYTAMVLKGHCGGSSCDPVHRKNIEASRCEPPLSLWICQVVDLSFRTVTLYALRYLDLFFITYPSDSLPEGFSVSVPGMALGTGDG